MAQGPPYLTSRSEKTFEHGFGFLRGNSVEHFWRMMTLGVRKDPRTLRHATGLGITGPVVEPVNACRRNGTRAHWAWLKRDIKRMSNQPLRPRRRTGSTQRQYFRMRGGIVVFACAVSCGRNNLAQGVNHYSPNGHFAAFGRCARLHQSRFHIGIELHPHSWPQTGPFRKSGKQAMCRPMSNDTPAPGDRIAKVLSRAGIASRREAERMIEAGRVRVNGAQITSPALNVTAKDRIEVDGKPVSAPEPARLWLYHKPTGLVSTDADEKGRETIYDALPEDMPRVMSVGRLDLNSEGLLLLTNDGGIKRKLELPATGWLRRYRVRVNGRPTDDTLAPLRQGLTADGEKFQPMIVTLDRQQGANAWLTIGLREGRNREIRRALAEVDLTVNRLIRISYGPFQLGDLKPGAVEEVRRKIMRDQLGLEADDSPQPDQAKTADKKHASRKPGAVKRTRPARGDAPRKTRSAPPRSRK